MILIDADILVYRIGWACNDEEEAIALKRMNSFIIDLLYMHLDTDEESDYTLYLTGKGNFRNDYAITATYKGNRADKPKPVHIQALRQHLIDKWDAVVTENEEADDIIAIMATTLGDDSTIVSLDKDFDQVQGWHYNFVKRNRYYCTAEEGLNFLYRQILMGDRIANIIGIRGIGEVKSAKLLADCTTELEYYAKVVEIMGDEDRVIENARLLYLRRTEGEIWQPPTTRGMEDAGQKHDSSPSSSQPCEALMEDGA